MNQTDNVNDSTERAKDLAFAAVKDELSRDYEYKTLVEQDDERWVFTFLPEGGVRGGGVEVTVLKKNVTIVDIVHLQ